MNCFDFETRPAMNHSRKQKPAEFPNSLYKKNEHPNSEMMGLFGKYDFDAFKLHLQSIHKGFSSDLQRA